MLIGLTRHVCSNAAAIAVVIALVFSTVSMGSAVDSTRSIELATESPRHHDMHSEAFSNEHLHDDVSSSEGHVGHSHGHSPDHSHEVPAFLERPMIGFIDGGQRWLLSLADRGIIDNRPILERPPRSI